MRVMIFEDEPPAVAQLSDAIAAWDPGVTIAATAGSVREAVATLRGAPEPDLVFADIRLSDGLSFQVFDERPVTCPVIFATAYDEHVIAAMERNAIDYLLKPIQTARVAQALDKYLRLRAHFGGRLLALARSLDQPTRPPPERVLARKGASIVAVPLGDVAWFTTEHKLTLVVQRDGTRLIVDEPLAALEARLDARRFFRLNRQVLAQVDAVAAFRAAGKGRLSVTLRPPADDDVVVAQENAAAFREWMAR